MCYKSMTFSMIFSTVEEEKKHAFVPTSLCSVENIFSFGLPGLIALLKQFLLRFSCNGAILRNVKVVRTVMARIIAGFKYESFFHTN